MPITLLDGEPLRNLLEKALLFRGVVCTRIICCHSVFKVEHRLLLLLLRLACFVSRACLRCLAAVDRGATGAVRSVCVAVSFAIIRTFRRLL